MTRIMKIKIAFLEIHIPVVTVEFQNLDYILF